MRRYAYVCDKCGKEVDTPIRVLAYQIDVKTDKEVQEEHHEKNELCQDCYRRLCMWIDAGPVESNYEAIIRLYREGKEIPEIEEMTGIPCAAVSRVIIKEGLGAERYPVTDDPMETFDDGHGRGYRISADKRAKVIEMAKDGYPPEPIAADLKLKAKTVAKVIQGLEAGDD